MVFLWGLYEVFKFLRNFHTWRDLPKQRRPLLLFVSQTYPGVQAASLQVSPVSGEGQIEAALGNGGRGGCYSAEPPMQLTLGRPLWPQDVYSSKLFFPMTDQFGSPVYFPVTSRWDLNQCDSIMTSTHKLDRQLLNTSSVQQKAQSHRR